MSALLENALVAQLDRVSDYESEGQGFESLRARQRVSVRKQYTEALFVFRNITGSMSIVGVTQNGNTVWSSVKLLHFSLNDGTYEECDCGSDENYDNRRHCV
jgi:hypothetical protein